MTVGSYLSQKIMYFVWGSITVAMADLLFEWFGFNSFASLKLTMFLLVWLNRIQWDKGPVVEQYFMIQKYNFYFFLYFCHVSEHQISFCWQSRGLQPSADRFQSTTHQFPQPDVSKINRSWKKRRPDPGASHFGRMPTTQGRWRVKSRQLSSYACRFHWPPLDVGVNSWVV